MSGYLERLADRSARVGSVLCLGIDPDPTALPAGFSADLRGVEAFARLLLEAAVPFAAAVKPNLAFFEAFGAEGMAALERLRAAVPSDVPVVADAKRGDIGSTAARQAVALFDRLAADAVTVSPYLGRDGIDPFVRAARVNGGGVFVLVKTSNPSSSDYQDRDAGGRKLFEVVADDVESMSRATAGGGTYGIVGAVVGATHAAELGRLRERMPSAWLLVPGYGAQGAGARDAAPAFDARGLGALVNASRTLNYPWGEGSPAPPDWRARIREAIGRMRDDLLRARDEARTQA
jgi:orotidine-5'-phosphate decarboxylase